MHPLNIFKPIGLPLKYPQNWIKEGRAFFRSFRYAYQRITRGAAESDYWDWDHTLLHLFYDGLDWFIHHSMSFPGNEQFPTVEAWNEHLEKIKQLFYQADETNEYYPTPYAKKWWATVQAGEENTELAQAMCQEEQLNSRKRQRDFQQAWKMMGEIFFHLWD